MREIVLVAQDLAAYGRDAGRGRPSRSCRWCEAVAERVDWVRLLYLYPSDLTDALIELMAAGTGVPYFDLSLQHVSRAARAAHAPLGRRRQVPRAHRATSARASPRPRSARTSSSATPVRPRTTTTSCSPSSRRRSSTGAASSPYSAEDGTYAADLDGQVADGLVEERLAELRELQDDITAARRDELIGTDDHGARRRARRRPSAIARRPRSTASSSCPRRCPSASSTGWSCTAPKARTWTQRPSAASGEHTVSSRRSPRSGRPRW